MGERECLTCETCRFWSAMNARMFDGEPLKALCLSDNGPCAGKYTVESYCCGAWRSDHHGAVDSPPNYGERARALYDADDQPKEQDEQQ